MYAYTLGFIKRKNEILLLNRIKSPWMGSWNGVGGKINENELPLDCMMREIYEETSIIVKPDQIKAKGVLTWKNFEAIGNGLYIYLIEVEDTFNYVTPIQTEEGILDWKAIDWINNFDNQGVAENIPYFLPSVLDKDENFHFHCTFEGRYLKKVIKTKI